MLHAQRAHRLTAPTLKVEVARYLPLLLLLGLAVHLLVPQLTALRNSLQVMRQMAWWAVGLAVIAQILSYVGSGYLLCALVALERQTLALLRGITIALAASSVGLVAGGMVGNAAAVFRWSRGSGVGRDGALLAGWLPSLLNNALLLMIALAGVSHLLLVHELTTAQAVGFGITLALILAAAGGILWGVRHQEAFAERLNCIRRRWATLLHRPFDPASTTQAVERISGAWDALLAGGWRGPMLGVVLNTGFDMLTLYLIFVAAGHPVSPGILLTGYGLPLLLGKAAFFLPGGVGVVEGTMVALYNGLGVPSGVTVVVILGYRALSFWIPSLLGFPLAAYLQRTATAPSPPGERAAESTLGQYPDPGSSNST